MNILFYTPFSSRSRDTESTMEAFVKQGHHVTLLTQASRGPYHEMCESLGVKTFDHFIRRTNFVLYNLKHILFLIRFCKKHNTDIIYAHLEPAGMVAVFAQYFIKAKVVVCRHIVDEAYLFKNKKFILGNKIVYNLARHVIVVSKRSKDFMIEKEKINPSKIHVINLGYNFGLFDISDEARTSAIRESYPCKLLLVTACRLIDPKRPQMSIEVAEHLVKQNLDIKLLILGEGPIRGELEKMILEKNLQANVFLLGHRHNVLDYLRAADVLLHPSILDSSSVIIKEAALTGTLVATCSDVGDVDDYLIDHQNAFLVERDHPVVPFTKALTEIYHNKDGYTQLKSRLKAEVYKRFDINNLLDQHTQLQNQLVRR